MTATDGPDDDRVDGGLLATVAVAAAAAVLVGFVGGGFRWCLVRADELRLDLLHEARTLPGPGWLVPIALVATGAAVARLVVRWAPDAAGSGIQEVEATWRGETEPAPDRVVPATFLGGLIGIGAGLVLGREGPTVHIGSIIGASAGRRTRRGRDDIRTLQAALGGAGLAVAFNAPLGGALFVFEEVTKSFRLRTTLVTLVGTAVAVMCSRTILGDHPDFAVRPIAVPPGWQLVIFAGFGATAGAFGAAYNRLVLACLRLADRLCAVPPELRAACIGAAVGACLWFDPLAVGGGDRVAQHLLGGGIGLASIAGLFVARFLSGPASYAAGTPGGLFAPLLALGALWGALLHTAVGGALGMGHSAAPLAIVGMTALFAASVRAPFTGIALIVEMTATTSLLLPMLVACFAATLVAQALRTDPIYDALRQRMLTAPDR